MAEGFGDADAVPQERIHLRQILLPVRREVADVSFDQRDATKKPPAYLSPLWILLMRERLKSATVAGWPALKASRETGAEIPDWNVAKNSSGK